MILLLEIAKQFLVERMSFTQLFNSSTPSRRERARDMQTTKLPVHATNEARYWNFQFRSGSSNNTTGKSWKGRISFPKSKNATRPDRLMCEVDCGCPDYKFRWAYANNKNDAGPIGFNSLNKNNGSPSRVTNPQNRPGLCKHLLALKDDLRKKLAESKQGTLETKLDEIVKQHPEFTIDVTE